MANDDEHEFQIGPFPMPPGMAVHLQQMADRQNMAHQDHENRVNRFVSELTTEQLGSLRLLFLHGDMGKSRTAHFWIGQIEGILRYVKKVDPVTEESLPEVLPVDPGTGS